MTLQLKALADDKAEILIYGEIGADFWGEGNDPKKFAEQLQQIKASTLTVRINSGGGDLFAGLAMYSALKQFKGKVVTYIDGLAASAASIIAMAGNEVIMPKNAILMIHNASTVSYGDHNQFRKLADDMETSTNAMVETYMAKTGMSSEVIKAMMDAETYLSANDALAQGFIDSIDEDIQLSASINNGEIVINGINTALPANKVAKISELLAIKPVKANKTQNNHINKEPVMSLTLEAFKQNHPDICEQIKAQAYQDGVQVERERIKSIEELEMQGHRDICVKAKFETGISAPEVAITIIKAEKQQRENYTSLTKADVTEVNKVSAASTTEIPHQDADALSDEFMQAFKAQVNKGIINAK